MPKGSGINSSISTQFKVCIGEAGCLDQSLVVLICLKGRTRLGTTGLVAGTVWGICKTGYNHEYMAWSVYFRINIGLHTFICVEVHQSFNNMPEINRLLFS